MTHYGGGSLEVEFGVETTKTLTTIYGDLLLAIREQRSFAIVPRHLRLRIVHALISEAERGETEYKYFEAAALVAVARYDEGRLAAEA